MKLYTEEQVKRAIAYARSVNMTTYENPTIERVLNSLTPIELPIELPSNEEITQYLNGKYFSDKMFRIYFIDGAKWMKEQILNQNK